nr:hypothetical protein [Tanacetum cinerariifolium]
MSSINQNAYSFNYPSNNFPQPQYENYLCNLCGNNSHDGYDCQQQFLFVYKQEPSYNQNYDGNYYPHESPSFPCCDYCGGSHKTFQCQPITQIIDFSGSDQIQNPQYLDVQENPLTNDKFEAYTIANDANMNDLKFRLDNFQKNQQDFQKKFEQKQDDFQNQMRNFMQNLYDGPPGVDKEHEVTKDTELPSTEDIQPLPVQEAPQNSDMRQLIRKECCVEVPEKQKKSMEDTMLELVKICQEKELLCIHDDVDDLIESALNSKLLLINSNSQHLDKKEQEVKNVIEQPAERGNRNIQSLQNFRNLLPIPSECEVALKDKRECDVLIYENSPICDNHSDIFSNSKIDDDISVYEDNFEDIEYVEASLPDPEIVSVEEENIVQQEEEKVDLEDISQIQDVVLREKLLSITRLISNIESLNDNSTPNRVLNSFESDNSLLDNFSPEFETFCDHTEETRSGNTTHADNSLPEYDSFCFEIEPDQERLINLVKNNIFDDLSSNSLLEEVNLFLFDNSISPGIENVTDDPEGDIHFLEELLIDNSILSHESFDSNFEENPSIPRPPPEPPDAQTDAGEEIPVVMNDKDEDVYYSFIFVIFAKMFYLLSAES